MTAMFRRLAALAVISLCSFVPALAQTTGTILGVVQDNTGAAVANATITVSDVNKGMQQTLKTDDGGNFNVPFLIPGTYRVTVEAPGSSGPPRRTSRWKLIPPAC